jgi:hypothetical protein
MNQRFQQEQSATTTAKVLDGFAHTWDENPTMLETGTNYVQDQNTYPTYCTGRLTTFAQKLQNKR